MIIFYTTCSNGHQYPVTVTGYTMQDENDVYALLHTQERGLVLIDMLSAPALWAQLTANRDNLTAIPPVPPVPEEEA